MAAKSFDVAIVGGGIGGLSMAIGLLKRGVAVTIYEAAHHFGEIGAGVFLQPNAYRAMEGIDPSMIAGLEKLTTHKARPELENAWTNFRHGEGEQAGEKFFSTQDPGPRAGVHRARFLDEIIKLVPQEIAHFGKRLLGLRQTDTGVELSFKDGTQAMHSCVVGADGIHSVVRKFVLGEEDPAVNAIFTGKYCHRGLISMERAVELVGDERARSNQFYLGHGCHLLTIPIQHGKICNVVAFSSCENWDYEKWVVPGCVKNIQEDFENFRGPAKKIVDELGDTDIWALFDHLPAKTFCTGNVVIIGDAAHATTPHQGSGAGVAIEDAYVLASLLAAVEKSEQLGTCFEAYNTLRRQRGLDLVTTSRETGWMWEMEHPDIGEDLEKFKANVGERFNWIWDVDLEGQIREGLEMMRD